jgi:glycosyltransferase involved in cell wall biosynthesis
LVYLMYERIAYGSDSAASAYRSMPLVGRVESEVFLELPEPALGGRVSGRRRPRTAVFVGELAARKGLHLLLPAWELVEAQCSSAELHIVGSGPLEAEIQRWTAVRPDSRRYHGHLAQREVVKLLPTCTSLVAPSIRWGRWREQIGLPIKEGLAAGLTVVTTTETGLASWLHSHGHHVLGTPLDPAALGTAILEALVHPLPEEEVLGALPRTSARLEADRWLHPVIL